MLKALMFFSLLIFISGAQADSLDLKSFKCTGAYQLGSLTLNAPSAEIAIGLYQVGAVLVDKTRGSTFTGSSYDLTKTKVSCIQLNIENDK